MIRLLSTCITFLLIGAFDVQAQHQHQSSVHSQYAGQENQPLKSLTTEDIKGLRSGAGTPFNGMAKPAELNGYPGPRHVLDAFQAGEFDLSEYQLEAIEDLFEEMQQKAIPLGEKIIELETAIDNGFKNKSITPDELKKLTHESGKTYADLRYTHLITHLQMLEILTKDQVQHYNELRGYTNEDPCINIPEGHDPEMWKKHNGCN